MPSSAVRPGNTNMTIDLQKDAATVLAAIEKSAEKYAKKHASKASSASHPLVTRIDLNFWLGDGGPASPFVLLQLDTRPGSEPDGTWTHSEFATLKFPSWKSPINAVFEEEAVTVKLIDGKSRKLTGDNMAKIFGEFFVAVMKSAKADGILAKLPKAEKCEFGVEESGGSFGWPAYEKRGRANLA
jgi:hypothetical protein